MLLKEQLVEVLKTLTPREEKVLRLRFGIDDGHTRTLEEVGKEFNVTRERIRQIESQGAEKAETSEPLEEAQGFPQLTSHFNQYFGRSHSGAAGFSSTGGLHESKKQSHSFLFCHPPSVLH